MTALCILPGLDGTTRMLDGFINEARQAGFDDAMAVAYPSDQVLDYAALETHVRKLLPNATPFVLLGESFSGPVALRIAADPPPTLRGLVLSTTFARTPVPLIGPFAPLTRIAPVRAMPITVMSWMLLGRWSTPALRLSLRAALNMVEPDVLRARAACALRENASALLAKINVPTLYLQARQDRLMHPSAGRNIVTGIGHARMKALDGPHLLLQTQAQTCARMIAAFAGVSTASKP